MVIKHVLLLSLEFFSRNSLLCVFSNCEFDLEVVVYGDAVREKPSSKEEAREFLKGLLKMFQPTSSLMPFSMTV